MIVAANIPLPVRLPFDFAQAQRFLGQFTPAMGEQVIRAQSLTKVVMVNGQVVGFRVSTAASPAMLQLDVLADQPVTDEVIAGAKDRAAFFLSLDDDLRPFYELAEGDPVFLPVVQQLYGYHQVKFLTPFENACWAVLSNRNRMAVASAMKARLTAAYGRSLRLDGVEYAAFPEAGAVLEADHEELASVVGHPQKAAFLTSVARAFVDIEEQWLRTAPYEEVEKWLLSIYGIGAWSASFVMIRSLGRMEKLKVPERHLVEAASRLYGRTLSERDVLRLAARYKDYQAYWAHYVRAAMT